MQSYFLYTDMILAEELVGQKQQRAEFIKQKLGNHWHGLPGFQSIDQFVEKLGEIDPSLKGIYMPWIARLVLSKPDVNKPEDLDRLGRDLQSFEHNKAKITNKDINAYKSFDDLFSVIEPFNKPRKKTPEELKKERELAKIAKVKGQILDVYNGPEGWIKIPTTEESSKFLGQNTRWCTASNGNCMFKHYAKDDNLFVIYDKATKKRLQLHINSGQLANEADKNIGIDSIPVWCREPIVDYYLKNNPQLTFKQINKLRTFTERDITTGTEHEDLFNLMKQYGV